MESKTFILQTTELNPWKNLALEEYLLNHLKPDQIILYLWQNQNTVVIGKHQNAWRECKLNLLEEEGGSLARRLSGGGAVFHDVGNLNFTFLVPSCAYNLLRQEQVIIKAVRSLGIDAVRNGRNDIVADSRKFSGNAFYMRGGKAYHHGTLLVDVDMNKMSRYLQVSKEKLKGKGVKSVQSRVVNLKELNPTLDIFKIKEALCRAFSQEYGHAEILEENFDQGELKYLVDKYASWEWRCGECLKFNVEFSTRFPWGGIELGLVLEHGMVANIFIYSDAMDEEYIENMCINLKGCRFTLEDFRKGIFAAADTEERVAMGCDLMGWLEQKDFWKKSLDELDRRDNKCFL